MHCSVELGETSMMPGALNEGNTSFSKLGQPAGGWGVGGVEKFTSDLATTKFYPEKLHKEINS